jgi:hypothetical protein
VPSKARLAIANDSLTITPDIKKPAIAYSNQDPQIAYAENLSSTSITVCLSEFAKCGTGIALGRDEKSFEPGGNETSDRRLNLSARLKESYPHADKVSASSVLYQQKFLLAETRQQPGVPPSGLLVFSGHVKSLSRPSNQKKKKQVVINRQVRVFLCS